MLGVWALLAEWRALMDAGSDAAVGHLKLAWWREEIDRAASGHPVHPITRYLADLPRVDARHLLPLGATLGAAAAHIGGASVETTADLGAHAEALYGSPLMVAMRLASAPESPAVHDCIANLAAGEYLARAAVDYQREARTGRVALPVDELLAAGIETDDLTSDAAPPRLQQYLQHVEARAVGHFTAAARALAAPERPPLRHLEVLAAMGATPATRRRPRGGTDIRLTDLYNAWTAARRAAAAE